MPGRRERGRRAGADGGGGQRAEVGGWLGGGLVGKGRGRGEIHRAPSVLKCERCCSPLDCRLSEWGRDLALRAELGRLRVMTKCQVSPGPPGEAGPRRGPRAAGVRSEESLPARVLCAAWRGCGQPPARASPGPTGGPPRRGAPPGRPGRSRRAPGQVLTRVPGPSPGSPPWGAAWESRRGVLACWAHRWSPTS